MKWIAVFLSLLSSPALADTITITFSGTVAPYSFSFAGQPFSTVWALTDGLMTSERLFIGSQETDFGQTGYKAVALLPTQIYLNITVVPGTFALNSFITADTPVFPADGAPFVYQLAPTDNLLAGSFQLGESNGYLLVNKVALANPDYVPIGPTSAVPLTQEVYAPFPVLGTGWALLFGLVWPFKWWRARKEFAELERRERQARLYRSYILSLQGKREADC